MSKKVVHLSDDAHELAKMYCKDSGMKMSDWVAMLIKRAVEPQPQVTVPAAPPAASHQAMRESSPVRLSEQRPTSMSSSAVGASPMNGSSMTSSMGQSAHNPSLPKKKPLREMSSENEDAVPVYAQPPFWARKSS